jgi:hypothetical protein
MSKVGLLDLDMSILFQLPVEERKKAIEMGVDLLIEQILLLSYKKDQTFIKTFNQVMATIDLNLTIEKENENYEMCYYYEELMWGLRRRMEEIKKVKPNV